MYKCDSRHFTFKVTSTIIYSSVKGKALNHLSPLEGLVMKAFNTYEEYMEEQASNIAHYAMGTGMGVERQEGDWIIISVDGVDIVKNHTRKTSSVMLEVEIQYRPWLAGFSKEANLYIKEKMEKKEKNTCSHEELLAILKNS